MTRMSACDKSTCFVDLWCLSLQNKMLEGHAWIFFDMQSTINTFEMQSLSRQMTILIVFLNSKDCPAYLQTALCSCLLHKILLIAGILLKQTTKS